MKLKQTVRRFYKNQIEAKSELRLALIALNLSLVIAVLSIINLLHK